MLATVERDVVGLDETPQVMVGRMRRCRSPRPSPEETTSLVFHYCCWTRLSHISDSPEPHERVGVNGALGSETAGGRFGWKTDHPDASSMPGRLPLDIGPVGLLCMWVLGLTKEEEGTPVV